VIPYDRQVILHLASFADLDTTTLYALLRLRTDVFVVEQQCAYPELDGRDLEPGTRHLWYDGPDGEPVAYLRILEEADEAMRIGRVCTASLARGQGLSAKLLAAALEIVGDRPCELHAQSYLVPFYQRYGFQVTGEEFLDDGVPHTPMRLTAAPPQSPPPDADDR
jgi:ElaA protein